MDAKYEFEKWWETHGGNRFTSPKKTEEVAFLAGYTAHREAIEELYKMLDDHLGAWYEHNGCQHYDMLMHALGALERLRDAYSEWGRGKHA